MRPAAPLLHPDLRRVSQDVRGRTGDPELQDQDVHQVGEVHDTVVDDEPDVVVVLGLVLGEDVPEGDDPGVVQEAESHHRQPTWASDDHIKKTK